MKTINEEKCKKKKRKEKGNKQRQKGARGTETILKGRELNDFCCVLSREIRY